MNFDISEIGMKDWGKDNISDEMVVGTMSTRFRLTHKTDDLYRVPRISTGGNPSQQYLTYRGELHEIKFLLENALLVINKKIEIAFPVETKRILFTSSAFGTAKDNPFVTLLEIPADLEESTMRELELGQSSVDRLGGNWVEIMGDAKVKYKRIWQGRMDALKEKYDSIYELIDPKK